MLDLIRRSPRDSVAIVSAWRSKKNYFRFLFGWGLAMNMRYIKILHILCANKII